MSNRKLNVRYSKLNDGEVLLIMSGYLSSKDYKLNLYNQKLIKNKQLHISEPLNLEEMDEDDFDDLFK